MLRKLLVILLSWSAVESAQAQKLTVSLPIEGAVYQQNAQHQGKIIIRGDFNSRSFLTGGVYLLSASLQKLDLTTGSPTNDSPISISLTQRKTTFSGERTLNEG
ncbi:hypothetical protein [Larkinella soli]|uniref:hypothetical protein n=1 Tax=Larkinella soli TaxID=1770527 RepID=UPI000FFB0FD5|nr:hypothetical protein [Larkinella soli]